MNSEDIDVTHCLPSNSEFSYAETSFVDFPNHSAKLLQTSVGSKSIGVIAIP